VGTHYIADNIEGFCWRSRLEAEQTAKLSCNAHDPTTGGGDTILLLAGYQSRRQLKGPGCNASAVVDHETVKPVIATRMHKTLPTGPDRPGHRNIKRNEQAVFDPPVWMMWNMHQRLYLRVYWMEETNSF
jgi:hypothetical protein